MQNFRRIIQVPDITKHSVFLWGARKVGKSSWLREQYPTYEYLDLLKTDLLFDYSTRPALLRERFEHAPANKARTPIIIDEIQKVPELLNEVHWLIENKNLTFLLTGSSARKLKRVGANMLGGRARRREMRPLCSAEVPDLNLDKAVFSGLIPSHYLSEEPIEDLRAYVADYVKEEIVAEAEVQNLPAFAEFLRVAALTSAELLNYTNIGREVGIAAKTVRGYFQILEDTLLGFRLSPWRKSVNRRLVETEKFYLFDIGVSNYLARRTPTPGTPDYGKSIEHIILMELKAYQSYINPELDITFWRTAHGQEIDFILGDKEVALEIKASKRTDPSDAKWLRLLTEDGPVRKLIIISLENERKYFMHDSHTIEVMPLSEFLTALWAKEII